MRVACHRLAGPRFPQQVRWRLGPGMAGKVALVLGVTVGHLADRHGARGVYEVS
ncbi:hypothetical protein [Streptomyces sp. PSAA01]|uniref:hypothetical protein n=1 Tax=Streptomyces sp. PSAA01 TaxID=2912762 RepID=UPI001F1F5E17|nr:hypothetical protein [Streptomyces sp. PSAA01]MCG0284560.1 hypothetical protein [Streptomyces sp. PSAA01]